MKKKKFFKNKIQMVCYIIIFIICIALFIVIGTTDYEKFEDSDAIKFNNIYNIVDKNNYYEFATAHDVLNVIKGRSGVILMGFPENKWTQYYAKYLNDIAIELNIDKILYYDFLRDRENSNAAYETIIENITEEIPTNDLGVKNIQAPVIMIVKNGRIIDYIDDVTFIKGDINPDEYFQTEEINLKEKLKNALEIYKGV